MPLQINANRSQRFQVQLLHIGRWWLQNYLQLCVLEESIWIFSVTTIRRSTRGLRVGNAVRLGPQHAQKCFWRHGSRAHFNVIRLLQNAAARRPKALQSKKKFLKGQRRLGRRVLCRCRHRSVSPYRWPMDTHPTILVIVAVERDGIEGQKIFMPTD